MNNIEKIRNLNNANIELKHIELELLHGRTQHLRHFIDQYYCYTHGFVNRNGKAAWGKIFFVGNVSKEAQKFKGLPQNRKQVVKEHVVPLKFITEKLEELGKDGLSCNSISALLDCYVHFATITKDEDQRLRDADLSYKMPKEFSDEKQNLFGDLFARYKMVEPQIVMTQQESNPPEETPKTHQTIDDIITPLESDCAREAIIQGHLDFPGSEAFDDWNTLPFGQPSSCKEKLIAFILDEKSVHEVLAKALVHVGNCCQGTTKLVLFYVDIAESEWVKVWELFYPAFNQLVQSDGIQVIIRFRGKGNTTLKKNPDILDDGWSGVDMIFDK